MRTSYANLEAMSCGLGGGGVRVLPFVYCSLVLAPEMNGLGLAVRKTGPLAFLRCFIRIFNAGFYRRQGMD